MNNAASARSPPIREPLKTIARDNTELSGSLRQPVESRQRYTLAQINEMSLLPYARTMAVVFANASWVPVLAYPHRPFRDLPHLFESMVSVLKGSDANSTLQVIDQQPDLVNPPPPEDTVSEFQLFECDLDLHRRLSPEHKTRLELLQKAYQERFGFLLVFAPFGKDVAELIQELESRLGNSPETEIQLAIDEAARLAHHRLLELLIL